MVNERQPLLYPKTTVAWWRWYVLFSFSFFSFSSALLWVSFSPCLYLFATYYFQQTTTLTTNAIHSLSSVYMLLYPLVIYFTFPIFNDTIVKRDGNTDATIPGSGLKRGILIGAALNAVGAGIRWLGALPSLYGFLILFLGQTFAALGQVFMLSVPGELAVAWFPESEINFATAIAVSANNLGIAVGCLWSPIAIQKATMLQDIPCLLLSQFIMCVFVFLFVWSAFQRYPPYPVGTREYITDVNSTHHDGDHSTSRRLFNEKNFLCLLISYGAIFGAQCAIITLIDQILLSPFTDLIGQREIGSLACVTLFIGVPGSILIGHYLDKTKEYRQVCSLLSVLTTVSLIALYVSIEYTFFYGVTVSCIIFGASSYSPAIFQYCGELFYPVNEIIPTGYLFLIGNIVGVVLVAVMGWNENRELKFSMRWPMLFLLMMMVLGSFAMIRVNGPLKRSAAMLIS